MGFWIFMLIADLLIPTTMMVFGKLFMKKAPDSINPVFGYRTAMSMKNKETWEFAHQYCGRLWWIWGVAMAFITVVLFLVLLGSDMDTIGTAGGILCFLQFLPLIGVILPTEKALRKNFDKDGSRIND